MVTLGPALTNHQPLKPVFVIVALLADESFLISMRPRIAAPEREIVGIGNDLAR
jgi:hypothetical protein